MTSPSSTVLLDPGRLHAHLPRLTRFATGLTGCPEAGDDLVQDTLERILRAPRRVSGDEFPYLARALRNANVDRIRWEARRAPTTSMPEALEATLPAPDHTSARHDAQAVLAAVAQLPDTFREVVVAVDISGASYTEAAAQLNIPVGTVMSRLYRGRRRVIEALDD